jgi:hypothetical protein
MSSLSTLPKGDSAWLLRKAIERIIEQVSVLETNIGVSTSGNSANTQIIFNDAGVLRGDAGLVYNKTTDALTVAGLVTAGSATITGDLTVNTNVLKVDSTNDRVGIGTASPGAALEVSGSATNIFLRSTDTNDSALRYYVNGTEVVVCRGKNGGSYAVEIAGTERLRINSTGNLVLGGGTVGATGVGVTFPATQVASSDANCLDDYEEGTWTPVVADASTGGNVGTCVINSATYTKIGRQVSIQFVISSIDTTGMAAGNALTIRGFPFAAATTEHGNFYTYRVGRNAATVSSCALVPGGTSFVQFYLFSISTITTNIRILVSDIVSGTSELSLSVTYTV